MVDQSFSRTFVIYPSQDFIVKTVAKQQFEGNDSMALRFIINDYGKRNLMSEPAAQNPGNGGQGMLVDPRAEYASK